jgi:fluoride exporter
MSNLLWISLGGALGTAARVLLAGWVQRNAGAFGTTLPLGTIAVNVIGSFLLGVLMQVGLDRVGQGGEPSTLRLALGTGVLGGFTTYSTFNYETLALFEDGAPVLAWVNLGSTLVGCLAASAVGVMLGRRIFG